MPIGASTNGGNGAAFTRWTGAVFVFNLIVGVGALTLPLAFARGGLLLGTILLATCGIVAFVCVTFVIEACAVSEHMSGRSEITDMTATLLGKRQSFLCTVALIIYLYGDLSIYAVSVARTLSAFFYPDGYQVCLAGFALAVGPFCFMTFSNTKPLQYATLLIRNVALALMISFAIVRATTVSRDISRTVNMFSLPDIPVAFGACVYSYMCHHSVPGIISLIKNKARLVAIFAWDYVLITMVYMTLCITAVVAFGSHQKELYTLNFGYLKDVGLIWMADFLELFPIFSLTSNFPLIAITLRNNLISISRRHQDDSVADMQQQGLLGTDARRSNSRRHWYSLLAGVPPIVIAALVTNVDILVAVTGSYAGIVIQFVIPALLIRAARRVKFEEPFTNAQASPFQHRWWPLFVLGFALASTLLVSISLIQRLAHQ
ncbi:Amino acid transporter transmembrane domain-containing protein [Plasmodiophora brassicae]